MPFSEVDDIAKLRRENRTFRYAFWELQRAGWYHGYHGWDLLEAEEEGHFLVHDGPCMSHVSLHDCHCLFVIEESNGIDKTPSSIGITFDDEANSFQLDEDSLDYNALKTHYQENPPFKSICNLVEYHGRNGIKLDEDIANINWECDYEDEYDVSGREEGPYSDEVYGILDHLVEESKMKYSSITLSVPILNKYK